MTEDSFDGIKVTSTVRVLGIAIYVQPGAKISGIAGRFDDSLKVKN
jgi:hypothetical protein